MIPSMILQVAGAFFCVIWFGWQVAVVVGLLYVGMNYAAATDRQKIYDEIRARVR